MAKKVLKIEFQVTLNDEGELITSVEDFDLIVSDFYNKTRSYLKGLINDELLTNKIENIEERQAYINTLFENAAFTQCVKQKLPPPPIEQLSSI